MAMTDERCFETLRRALSGEAGSPVEACEAARPVRAHTQTTLQGGASAC